MKVERVERQVWCDNDRTRKKEKMKRKTRKKKIAHSAIKLLLVIIVLPICLLAVQQVRLASAIQSAASHIIDVTPSSSSSSSSSRPPQTTIGGRDWRAGSASTARGGEVAVAPNGARRDQHNNDTSSSLSKQYNSSLANVSSSSSTIVDHHQRGPKDAGSDGWWLSNGDEKLSRRQVSDNNKSDGGGDRTNDDERATRDDELSFGGHIKNESFSAMLQLVDGNRTNNHGNENNCNNNLSVAPSSDAHANLVDETGSGSLVVQVEMAPLAQRPRRHPLEGEEFEEVTRPSGDQDDQQPSHGFSLAKWKLTHRSEPSMTNSALINGRANLVCDIQAPSADDSVALVLWYKDDSLAPIYTVDARKVNSLDKAKISVDEHYSARLNFDLRTRPAQLQLDELRPEDEGEYRCRVDFKRGRTVNTIIELRIVIPPSELAVYLVQQPPSTSGGGKATLIRLSTGSTTTTTTTTTNAGAQTTISGGSGLTGSGQLVGPFDEGAELELLCVARGGKPRAQLQWRRNFSVINTTASTSAYLARTSGAVDSSGAKDETSAVLRLPALNREHMLSVFICQATNTNLTNPLASALNLDLNLKPNEVTIRRVHSSDGTSESTPEVALLVGQTATFECITSGSKPQATIHWLFQGQRHDSPMQVEQQQTSSKLTLVLQRSFNQAPLACVAENSRIGSPGASKQTTIKLDVNYPPQLAIKLDARHQSAADLQEGNDIYLNCQLDANPRPTKPIVWRFNGRPLLATGQPAGTSGGGDTSAAAAASAALLQSNGGSVTSNAAAAAAHAQGPIVIGNATLVLRKVSRRQSGSYTCEAANRQGSNQSKAFELAIRHAPVCATDDILVYEGAVGQTLAIDCQVHALPSKSVHFSWFLAHHDDSPEVNDSSSYKSLELAHWLGRDASLDEQLDVSSQQLKFKLKSRDSLALLKCKAKNEIGLQQRVCLFQVSVAKSPPTLRHTCALGGTSAGSGELHLGCHLNEHLKTNLDDQLRPEPEVGGGGGNQWIKNFRAIKQSMQQQQQQQQSADEAPPTQVPNSRLVHPPAWLLVEVYKQSSSGDQADANYELQAYVIVSGPSQLSEIKSIVEETRLFHSNPRDIYYVAAKQQQANSSTRKQTEESISSTSRMQPTIRLDPSLELADVFNFTVPNLEPETRYKLLIYGQNLANKTRDWLVVRATTGANFGHMARDEPPGRPVSKSFKMYEVDSAAGTNSSLVQKSLVMRSEQLDDKSHVDSLEFSANDSSSSSSSPVDLTTGGDATKSRNAHASSSSSQLLNLHLLEHYKDQALAFAKQKPLVSIPASLIALLLIGPLIIYLLGQLVTLVRGESRSSTRRHSSASGGGNDRKSRYVDSQADQVCGRGGGDNNEPETSSNQTGASLDDNDHNHSPQGQLNSLAALLPGDQSAAHLHLIDKHPINQVQTLDAIALGDCWTNQRPTSEAAQFLGSLDRRGHRRVSMLEPVGPTIYLTESGPGVRGCGGGGQFGSIDRRLPAATTFFVQDAHESYQPLFVSTGTTEGLSSSSSPYEMAPAPPNQWVDYSGGPPPGRQLVPVPRARERQHHNRTPASCTSGSSSGSGGGGGGSGSRGFQARRQAAQSMHRVAFDLGVNQVRFSDDPVAPPDDNLAECERAFQSLIKCSNNNNASGQLQLMDSSSGSNNSAAGGTSQTADSGLGSPALQVTNGTNARQLVYDDQETSIVHHHLPGCNLHNQYGHAHQVQYDGGILRNGRGGGRQKSTALEFASPSSQESSATLVHSVDSFCDHSLVSSHSNNANVKVTTTSSSTLPMTLNLKGPQQQELSAALMHNHQMITSFASTDLSS